MHFIDVVFTALIRVQVLLRYGRKIIGVTIAVLLGGITVMLMVLE